MNNKAKQIEIQIKNEEEKINMKAKWKNRKNEINANEMKLNNEKSDIEKNY